MANNAGRIIRAAPYRETFTIRDSAGTLITAATGLDSEFSQDSNTYGDCTNEATAIGASGGYYLDFVASETDAERIDYMVKSSEGVTVFGSLIPEPALNSGVAQSATASSLTLASTASATDDLYNGAALEIVRGTGAGQIRTIVDYTGSSNVASIDRNWITNPDSTSVYVVHPKVGLKMAADVIPYVNVDQIKTNATAATNMEALYQGGFLTSSVADATPTTTAFDAAAGLSGTDDFYNGQFVVFTSGTLKGYAEQIDDYTGSTRTITLRAATPTAPGNGDEFTIIGRAI